MPGVYLEYIKAGKFVVPVELTFQTETIKAPGDIRGLVNTSKWIERHNWKEIKAMLKPAVEACLKYNETPLENIPKSHHISYGREVSLGYLIVRNEISSPLLSVLDTKKNCWTDDEDDEDELLGIRDTVRMEDHGSEFTEFIPTKTAIRVCVVRKSVVSIDDARRIRKELGVRSEDVRHYFSSATHLANDPGSSAAANNRENFDKEKMVSEWAASAMYSHLRDSGSIGLTSQPTQSSSANFFNSDQQVDRDVEPTNGTSPIRNDPGSDSEVENIPRTFGDPDEIRDAARIYPHVLNRDVDSGEDPDDDLSLPDIEPNPPKRKKGSRTRKKSASLSPSKSKRLTHTNILAISQEGQATFSEEDTAYNKRGTKKSKRKRTVAVVEPMRTLPNGQVSFEHAIGALGSEKRRKARPGSSHGTDKMHSGGGRSKQPPAIDIVAPDDDRLTITNPPEPLTVASSSASHFSPFKDAERQLESERKKLKKKKKKRRVNIDDDPHKYERLTPSPLFSDNDAQSSDDHHSLSCQTESDLEMPVLTKMVDSGDEGNQENCQSQEENAQNPDELETILLPATQKGVPVSESQEDDKSEDEVAAILSKATNEQASPDITQIKTNATLRRKLVDKKSFRRKLQLPPSNEEDSSKSESSSSKTSPNITESRVGTPQLRSSESTSHIILRSESKLSSSASDTPLRQTREAANSANESEPEAGVTSPETTSPVQTKPLIASSPVSQPPTKLETLPIMHQFGTPKQQSKDKSKKRLKNVKKKPILTEKEKVKPKMADGQTQTDELLVVAQIEKKFNGPMISNAIVKVSRSCDVSSEDEFFDIASQRSRRSLLASPITNSEASQPAIPTIYHPALGSPDTELFEDDGLFSFESPSIPVLSSSQTLETIDDDLTEHLPEENDSPEREHHEENEVESNDNSHEEIPQPPGSPQPGCSHWPTIPLNRSMSPPPPTLSALMPPPISRPPRTPRKLFDPDADEPPPRLSIGSPEPVDIANDVEEIDNEGDTMPAGAEAANVSEHVGRIYNVLNQPGIFRAGMRLIQKVATKEMSAKEMESTLKMGNKNAKDSDQSKALVPVSAAQRKRDLSPDICDLVPDKRLRLAVAARRSRRDSFDESRNNQSTVDDDGPTNAVVLRHVNSDDEASDMENASNNEKLMDYFAKVGSGGPTYEPHGDEFDLSQRSYCMLNVVPQYELKSRLYKIHSKAVRETSVREVLEYYKKIQSELFGIFRGTIFSLRHDIFVKGFEAKRDLRNLNVTVPFTTEQGSALHTMIYDKLVPDKSMRCDYMDYVNYVLVPEAFIRIYARINNISFDQAEVEMRFKAFYEGDVTQQYLSLQSSPSPSLD